MIDPAVSQYWILPEHKDRNTPAKGDWVAFREIVTDTPSLAGVADTTVHVPSLENVVKGMGDELESVAKGTVETLFLLAEWHQFQAKLTDPGTVIRDPAGSMAAYRQVLDVSQALAEHPEIIAQVQQEMNDEMPAAVASLVFGSAPEKLKDGQPDQALGAGIVAAAMLPIGGVERMGFKAAKFTEKVGQKVSEHVAPALAKKTASGAPQPRPVETNDTLRALRQSPREAVLWNKVNSRITPTDVFLPIDRIKQVLGEPNLSKREQQVVKDALTFRKGYFRQLSMQERAFKQMSVDLKGAEDELKQAEVRLNAAKERAKRHFIDRADDERDKLPDQAVEVTLWRRGGVENDRVKDMMPGVPVKPVQSDEALTGPALELRQAKKLFDAAQKRVKDIKAFLKNNPYPARLSEGDAKAVLEPKKTTYPDSDNVLDSKMPIQ